MTSPAELEPAVPMPVSLLDVLLDAELLTLIDVQLARMMVRRSASADGDASAVADAGIAAEAISLAIAFTSRAVREGHSAITLDQLASDVTDAAAVVGAEHVGEIAEWDADAWDDVLMASALVGDGEASTPLVLRDDLLQFKRYFDAEARIAARVQELAAMPAVAGIAGLSIVTGGPGTGKTTFVARKLVELRASQPGLRVALAAPTGKAAARLTESIGLRIAEVSREATKATKGAAQSDLFAPAPTEARTLHRLLGYSPGNDRYRRNAIDPLEDDLVIIDETSMVDVLLLDAVLRALKPGARLMLVGDHQQLASVDAGDVLGALCRAALAQSKGTPLRDAVTLLSRSWRFEQQPGIGVLANAVLAGDANAVYAACTNPDTPDIRLRPTAASTDALLEPMLPHLEACLAATSPASLLTALDGFRILAPERDGRVGVNGINAAVERWLARRGVSVTDTWYHGRPVLVTANDYATGVFNGDVGVVWREAGQLAVYFRGANGAVRAISPVRLPAVETAWAMTVHKSQGSEFDSVLVVVPDYDSRVMNRELLYTAVTRARRSVTIAGGGAAIAAAVERGTGRMCGLGARLKET